MRVNCLRSRRGITLIELSVAAFLVVAVMTITLNALAWTAGQHRRIDRRQAASREAANAIERLAAQSWNQVGSEPLELSVAARKALPDAAIKVDVSESDPGFKRIRVEISWRDGSDALEPRGIVRLTAWRARRDGRKS